MELKKNFYLVCATLALISALFIFGYAISVFFLIFAGLLLAIFLEGLTSWIIKFIKLPYKMVLVFVILILIISLSTIFWIATPLIAAQLSALVQQVPLAYEEFKKILSSHIELKFLTDKDFLKNFFKENAVFTHAAALFSSTVGTIVGFIVFLFVGIYVSFNPKLYREGFLSLFAPAKRVSVRKVLAELGSSLRYWILGKFISMAAIGILSTIGLWLLNVPLAFILGMLAGILAFIPYLGAIIAALPAILIGFSVSPFMALYVIFLYFLIHAIEGYFITPFVEQRTVSLPPALTVSVQIILSLLVGFIGLALASPVTAVIIVLIRELYIKRIENK